LEVDEINIARILEVVKRRKEWVEECLIIGIIGR